MSSREGQTDLAGEVTFHLSLERWAEVFQAEEMEILGTGNSMCKGNEAVRYGAAPVSGELKVIHFFWQVHTFFIIGA